MGQRYILCVDDEVMNLDLLEAYLADQFEVKLVNDGFACLESVAERQPDIILLDVMMPEIDGKEVCQKLKTSPETKHIPVIFVTGMADTKNLQELRSGPADALLSKPFSRDQILELIDHHLS